MKKGTKKSTKRRTRKEIVISKILAVIKQWGSFGIEDHDTICVNEMGDLTAEASFFSESDVEVKVYRPSGVSSDPITSYYLTYEEIEEDILEDILRLAEYHKLDCDKAWERSQN